MKGEFILTDRETALIIASELGTRDATSTLKQVTNENKVTYELNLSDDEITEAVKSFLLKFNIGLRIDNVYFTDKSKDANRFTITEEDPETERIKKNKKEG